MNIHEFIEKTRILINKEREAEVEETKLLLENVSPKVLEHRGVCILHLRIASRTMGLYGRTVLTLEPVKQMPSHNLTPGDIVGLSLSQGDTLQKTVSSGVISRVSPSSVCVAFDDSNDLFDLDDSVQYRIVKLANDITYRRLLKALDKLNENTTSCGHLKNVLFGLIEPSPPLQNNLGLVMTNENLDDSQKEAVRFALDQPELAIVHGPPGTGKTTTVTEIIQQAVRQGLKVLACAPSNVAVDNLVERLAGAKVKLVRLGHPARLLPTIQCHSLDAILASSDETRLVEDVRADINKSLKTLRQVRNKGERQNIRQEIKQLRKELRQREEAAVKQILSKASVVLATLTMASEDGPLGEIDKHRFDIVVIDECSQALEVSCWIALLRANRCILAGDHNQLPPTILSHEAAKEGLEITLMERLVKLHKERVVRMLTMQYRMNENIMAWSSRQLYDSKLIAHQSVAAHLLRDLPNVQSSSETDMALLLIDTAGCDLNELTLPDGASKGNEGEADVAVAHVEKLISSGLPPVDIAVIAPYNLQVELLRLRLAQKYPKLEIKSVDGFQGREKEAVVICLVRSNTKGEVGFLAEDRRINVAVTRARRHLAVVCDSETVSHHAFLKSLVDHMTQNGEVRSAQEYIQEGALNLEVRRPLHLQDQLRPTSSKSSKPSVSPASNGIKTKTHKPGIGTGAAAAAARRKGSPGREMRDAVQPDDQATDRAAELRQELIGFTEDESSFVYRFPVSLTSRDRYLVHEIADELGLIHLSRGEGAERCIEVRKPEKAAAAAPDAESAEPGEMMSSRIASSCQGGGTAEISESLALATSGRSTEDQAKEDDKVPEEALGSGESSSTCAMTRCQLCGQDVPRSNLDLHSLRCESMTDRKRDAGVSSKPTSKKEVKVKPAKNGLRPNAEQAEDFDSIVSAAMKENKTCHVERCKNSTATLGQDCAFCRQRFCLSHHIPEAHGCGDRARQHARRVISSEGVLHRGSGVPSKKPDPHKRAQLERKLGKKLDELAYKRKPKPKEK